MEPLDVRNLLWLGWIFDGEVMEIYQSNLTIEETVRRSSVRALEDWLKLVDKDKFTRKWSNGANLETISAEVVVNGSEVGRTGKVTFKVTVLGYWAGGSI